MPLGSVSGTGPFQFSSVSGAIPSASIFTFGYFSGDVSGVGQVYANAPDPSVMDFGLNLSEVVMINTGGTNIALQWKEFWGQNVDNGIIPAGATIVLRKVIKSGMKVRCADVSGSASCLIWGI